MSDLLRFDGNGGGYEDLPTEQVSFVFHQIPGATEGDSIHTEKLEIVHERILRDGDADLTAGIAFKSDYLPLDRMAFPDIGGDLVFG